MTTRVVLVRHASVDTGARLCGSFDVPLSPDGRAQLRALLAGLPAAPLPHALYTSPLRRASAVATALGAAWGLAPRPAPWAQEIHCGEVEGLPLARLQQVYPDLWTRNLAQNDERFAWPGGETYCAFRHRIVDGLAAAAAAHPFQRITVVTHAGVISQVMGLLHGRCAAVWEADRPEPLTATEVEWHGRAPVAVIAFNERHWF